MRSIESTMKSIFFGIVLFLCLLGISQACPVDDGTTTEAPPIAKCNEGYVYFEPTNSCYGREPSTGVEWYTWPKAERYCEIQGGHLPSIHSPEENEFIVSLAFVHKWSLWIGFYSVDEHYSWKWSDATLPDYVPWFHGYDHPLYPDVNASCVAVNPYWNPKGSFVNAVCSEKNYFLCQLPALS